MRRILSSVWRKELKPEKAQELLRLQLQTRAGPFSKNEEELLLGILDALYEGKFKSVNVAEEEISCLLKIDVKQLCQT